MTRTLGLVALLMALLVIVLAVPAMAQGDSPVADAPTADTLRTAAGISIVVALITNLLRGVVPAGVFDKWGPTIAVVVGILLALVGVLVSGPAPSGDDIVTAILAGAFGGFMSQNVNTVVTRALRPSPPAG